MYKKNLYQRENAIKHARKNPMQPSFKDPHPVSF
jgi:hypothetical protein